MPSLFHRRTRSASAQRPQTPVSSNAHLAAAQAFMANRVSQGQLSASAAATALRTMSPPPVPVDQIQTKRMQRRSSSASLSNAPRGRSRGGGLDRQGSSGSMTERTFRTPSPGRPGSSGAPELAPPVPSIPYDIPPVPKLPVRSSRRAVSMDTGPTRVISPPPNHARNLRQPPAQAVQPSREAARRVVSPEPQSPSNVLQRTDSRNSVNFSRPLSPTPQSPIANGNNRSINGISLAEAERVQYAVTATAAQPVKKKKKKVAPRSTEGSHLHTGTMASHPIETPLEPGPPQPPQLEQPVKKKKKKAALTGQSSHFPEEPVPPQVESDSDSTPEKQRRVNRASGLLMKQPSVVREDWEGEQEDDSPQQQRREDQDLTPVASPMSAIQVKKTQQSANMSKKIEEPTVSPKPAESSPASVYNAVTGPQEPAGLAPSALPKYMTGNDAHSRTSSLSPSRSTRFSDRLASDLSSGRKHEPLPRSVSPAKSALKHHSPSPQADGQRLTHTRGSSATPSDASDSNLSTDGSARRKKLARVSFDPTTEVVGTAAEQPDISDSPTVASPQNKDPRRGFFGLGRSKPTLTTIPSEDALDQHMQPRPQLPSFGSVRGKSRRDGDASQGDNFSLQQPASGQVGTTPSSSDSSVSNIGRSQDMGASSDHAVGGLLSQEAARRAAQPALTLRDPNLPLPPEVTSVEGSGYISDTASDMSEINPTPVSPIDTTQAPSVPQLTKTVPSQDVHAEVTVPKSVPQFNVQPPTPGTEAQNPVDQWLVEVPGGFPGEEVPRSDAIGGPIPAAPVVETATSSTIPIAVATSPSRLAAPDTEADEESTDNDSIYSDAAEDPSELDGDGFGSINAIVDSPVIDSPIHRITTPPDSPLAKTFQKRPQESERTTSWDKTQERWSGIAQQTRQTIQNQPPPSQPLPQAQQPSPSAQLTVPKPKKKKMKQRDPAVIAAAPAPVIPKNAPASNAPPLSKNQASTFPTLRTNQQQSTAPLRSSMRTPEPLPAGRRLQDSRWANETARQRAPAQPAPVVASPPARAALQKKHIPPAAAAARQAPKPALKPAPVPPPVDDDSDSSFKKARQARRSKSSNPGAYSMRQSMRAAPTQEPPRQPGGRGAVRSLSPPVRRPFNSGGDSHQFRSSMRGPADTAAPTLRREPSPKRSSSLFGRNRKTKSPGPALPIPLPPPVQSRIADSDDEDDTRPSNFSSRYADDSDDDAEPLRPVRGIPKGRGDDGDSTDLDDSSDEEGKRTTAVSRPALNVNTSSPRPATGVVVPTSPTTKKKGLFARLRGKKDKDAKSQPVLPASPTFTNSPGIKEKEEEAELGDLGFSSTAERDAMIQQAMAKLEAAKQEQATATVPNPTEGSPLQSQSPVPSPSPAGKLQRRQTPERVMSDSWPLVPKLPVDEDVRPSSSDAVGPKPNGFGARPGIGSRIATSETLKTEGGTPIVGRSGKKKRFPMLRKAFGLRD